MTVKDLRNVLMKKHGFSRAFSGRVLSSVLETIRNELAAGQPVKIRNFGSFRIRKVNGKDRVEFEDSPNFFSTSTSEGK